VRNAGSLGTRIARDAARVDGSAIELGFAIRSTVGVTIVVVLSNVFQAPIAGAAGALGAVVVGFASRQGVYRTRATAMIITSLAMAVTAFAACLTHGNIYASIAIAAAFGFGYGLIAALGPTAITIATNSAVALAIFGSISLSPADAAYQCSFVVAGGLLQTLLLVVLWPFERFSHERTILATAFRSLAAYARSFPSVKLRSPAPETFTKLTDVFADMQPFAKRGEIAAFEVLFDETERIRGALAALATEKFLLERRNRTTSVEAIEAAGVAAANVMSEIAGSLASARAPKGDALWDAFEEPLEALAAREDTFSRRAHTDLEALLGQLRSTWRAAFAPAGKEPPETGDEIVAAHPRAPRNYLTSEFSDALATLRANLSLRSEYARHGLRLALVLGVAVLAEHLLPLQRAYWIVLTAALVLRPDFGTTYSRGVARIAGTLAGAVLASLIIFLHPSDLALGILSIVFAFASYVFIPINYGLFTLTITAYVVFVIGLAGSGTETSPERTIVDRVLSTLIGGAIALVAYAAWPTWERRLLPRRFAELLEALSRYGSAIFGAYLAPERASDGKIHDLQLGAWLARSNAEASFDRMSAEPVKPDTLTVRAALGILAASRRYGLALLSLNVHRPREAIAACDAFAELSSACTTSLAVLAQSLRTRRKPAKLPKMRELHSAFVAAIGTNANVESSVAAAETDLMVDAINTIARLLERRYAQAGDVPAEVRRVAT
jgi:uncharacterized membrane protein YccC